MPHVKTGVFIKLRAMHDLKRIFLLFLPGISAPRWNDVRIAYPEIKTVLLNFEAVGLYYFYHAISTISRLSSQLPYLNFSNSLQIANNVHGLLLSC